VEGETVELDVELFPNLKGGLESKLIQAPT
jgi:hypothetical protein